LYYDIKGDRGEFEGALHGVIVGLGLTFKIENKSM